MRLYFSIIFMLIFLSTVANATTVVTYNLANYDDHGNWSERVKLLADEIIKTKAEIIVLQEVRFNPDEATTKASYQNMAEQLLLNLNQLGDFKDAQLVTQPVMYYPLSSSQLPESKEKSADKKSHIWEGLSVISKRKILETGSIFLNKPESCSDFNKRITQYVKIENADAPLFIGNVHFGLDKTCVEDNAKETLAYLKNLAKDNPLMIVGDYNATPDNPIFKLLSAAQLTDAWSKLHPNEKGFTYPAEQPTRRIDYMWVSPYINDKLFEYNQIKVLGNVPTNNNYPSDHLGLLLNF